MSNSENQHFLSNQLRSQWTSQVFHIAKRTWFVKTILADRWGECFEFGCSRVITWLTLENKDSDGLDAKNKRQNASNSMSGML